MSRIVRNFEEVVSECSRSEIFRERRFILSAIACTVVLILAATAVFARDRGQFAQSSPEIKQWFDSLRDKKGTPCCDTSDGFRVEDPDWRNVGDAYEVKIDGEWRRMTDDQLVTTPNRIGYAMVWIFHGRIICFMPGARG